MVRQRSIVDDLADAIYHEERRKYLRELRETNDRLAKVERAREREEERRWQAKWWRPPPPNPTFPINRDDGLVMRAVKHVANHEIYDSSITLRRWFGKDDEQQTQQNHRAMLQTVFGESEPQQPAPQPGRALHRGRSR
jgi:hypothetical protein